MKKGVTVKEATHEWVSQFNAIPQGMVSKLMQMNPDEWTEITRPCKGKRVYLYKIPSEDKDGNEYNGTSCYGEVSEVPNNDGSYIVELDDNTLVRADFNELEIIVDGFLPIWGTMWSFGDSCDDYWLEELNGTEIMSECGFRIYEHEEFGYFFGIDGAGYDFYSEHWIPLYRKRGLQWHDPETEQK